MKNIPRLVSTIPIILLSLDIGAEGMVDHIGKKTATSLTALLIVAWSTMLKDIECSNPQEVEQHLEMGKKLLAAGQLADALSHYHAAVEGDPNNYMTYFKRATVFLAMGKSKSALPDLDKVIELKPDFTAARLQRANVKLKQGKLQEALQDYNKIPETDRNHAAAQSQKELIQPTETQINQAKDAIEIDDWDNAVELLTPAVEVCPWDPTLRQMRASCYIKLGDYFKAVGDIRPTTRLIPDNTAGFYQLSKLYYMMGEADTSLLEIRECLKLDPDHKDCFAHYKKVKKLVKQMDSVREFTNDQQWDDCIEKAEAMMKTEPDVFKFQHRAREHLCKCHSKAQHISEGFSVCNQVLEADEKNIEALCDRAEIYIADEKFEEAIKDFQAAETVDNNNRRAEEGIKRAQKLLKQSQKRDYYKILGVRRNAKKREIIQAYRKLAAKWHPDKYEGDDKAKAEKTFIDIAAAKEVLTDPEKRQQFDQGVDPLDPEEQSGGHNPFHQQGFNPFGGGGGYNFKFHFN